MKKIWSVSIMVPVLIITLAYVVMTVYLMNASLIWDTLWGDYSWSYKWSIMIALLHGMWTAMSISSLWLLTIVALLTGLNVVLTVERLRSLRSAGKLHWAIGGSSLIGLVGSGCASCGLPILALLGLGGAAVYLPYGGMELSLLAIMLLGVSLYFLMQGRMAAATCKISTFRQGDKQSVSLEGGERV